MKKLSYLLASLCILSPHLWSATLSVTNTTDSNTADVGAGSLRAAMIAAASGDTIKFSLPPNSTITLASDLPIISAASLTIDGSTSKNLTIDGNHAARIFFVNARDVKISNLNLVNGTAAGGAGGGSANSDSGAGGGGGGLGAGGSVFITGSGSTTLQNMSFTGNTAIGGAGGVGGHFTGSFAGGGGGGGGGLNSSGGAGGTITETSGVLGSGGGGGGGYNTTPVATAGGVGSPGASGVGGNGAGGVAGGGPNSGLPPQTGNGANATLLGTGGGGGAGGSDEQGNGVPGATGGSGASYGGGAGGGGGGGGGGAGGAAGSGSYAGGGGGAGISASGSGAPGNGGFGAGGGGGGGGGTSGYGGGTPGAGGASAGGGGGGAGFGGALFVQNGGALVLQGSISFSGNTVQAGADGGGGTTALQSGPDIFLSSGAPLTFTLTSPLTISTTIGADSLNTGGGLTLTTGNLTLTASNSYVGGTTVSGGVLAIASDASLGVSAAAVMLSGTLKNATASGNITTAKAITMNAASTIDSNGGTFTFTGPITGATSLQVISSTNSSGTCVLSGTGNSYSGGLILSSGNVLISDPSQVGSGPITFNGGSLETATTLTLSNSLSANTSTTSGIAANGNTTLSLSAALTGAGTINLLNNTASTAGVIEFLASTSGFTGILGIGGSSGNISLLATTNLSFANAIVLGSGGIIDTGTNTVTLSGAVTGTGTKAGSGILLLNSASNASTSTINVNAGTLQVNSNQVGNLGLAVSTTLQFGVTGLNLSKAIVTGATSNIDTQSFTETISGVIGGSGFTKIGSGTLILSGANTYSGVTTVSAGTLQISSDTNLGSSPSVSLASGTTLQTSANLTSNAAIALAGNATIDTQSFALNLSHAITGGNALTKIGSGTLTLATGNSISATTVSAGTLGISDSSAGNISLSSGADLNILSSVTVTSAITLGGSNIINSAANTVNLSGNVSGTGPFVKQGTGILVLSGTNTYTGGTQITQGILQISSDTHLGSGTLSLTSSTLQAAASFTLNHAISTSGAASIDTNGFNLVEAGVISGSGNVTKKGLGILTYSSANTYTGTTLVLQGTLALSGSGQLPPTGVVLSTGTTLDISGASSAQTIQSLIGEGNVSLGAQQLSLGSSTENAIFDGTFSGTGNLVKQGTQTLSLGKSSPSYTGTLFISQGALNLMNITLPGPVNIQTDGLLQGIGHVGTLTNAGTLTPGNSIGTIHVDGNYSQTVTGTLVAEVSSGASDLVDVTGSADLNGALEVIVYPGTYLIGNTYPLVTTGGGVSGAWSKNNLASLPVHFGIQYLTDVAELVVIDNNVFFGKDIQGFNPNAVANYLSANVPDSDSPLSDTLLQLGELDSSELTAALNRMHPAQVGAIRLVRESQAAMLAQMLSYRSEELCCQRLETAPVCSPTAVWLEPYDQFLRIDSIEDQKGFNSNTVGFALGVDHCFSSGIALGAASGYSYTHLDWMQSAGSSNMHSVFAGLYSDWIKEDFSLNISATGARDFFDVTRHIFYSGFDAQAKSDHHAWEYDVHLGLGYDYPVDTWTSNEPVMYLRPFTNFDYFSLFEDSYQENGAGALDLSVRDKHSQFLRSQLGIQLSHSMLFSKGCWSPSLWLSWINIYTFSSYDYVSNYIGLPNDFVVHSFQKMWNLFSPGFDISVNFHSGLILVMKYQAQFNGSYMIQQGNVRFEWSF